MKNNDAALAHKLASEWHQLSRTVYLLPDDPLARRAAEVFQWLGRADRRDASLAAHEETVAALRKALAEPSTLLEDLEELYLVVADHKPGVPALLDDVYRRRVRQMRGAAKFREYTILAVVFVAGMMFLVLFLMYIFSGRR